MLTCIALAIFNAIGLTDITSQNLLLCLWQNVIYMKASKLNHRTVEGDYKERSFKMKSIQVKMFVQNSTCCLSHSRGRYPEEPLLEHM